MKGLDSGYNEGIEGVGKTGRISAERVKLKIQESAENKIVQLQNDAVDDIHNNWPARIGVEKEKETKRERGTNGFSWGRGDHSMASRQGSEMTVPGYRGTRRSKDAGQALGPLFPWLSQGHSRCNWPLIQPMVVMLGHLLW